MRLTTCHLFALAVMKAATDMMAKMSPEQMQQMMEVRLR